MDIKEEIQRLKKEKNALILAHNYQIPEIQDLADFVGDSLELSRKSAGQDVDIIVFCGVVFMAETAKILSPACKVLIPSIEAGCFLADTISGEDVRKLREKYPEAVFVAYVNTSADVKAEVDICCTSANAVKVVESIPRERPIVFLPDRNLGKYVIEKTGRDNIILWEKGYCYVHELISPEMVREAKEKYPGALVIAHPECRPEVLAMADAVASTSGMIRFAEQSSAKRFIICTEKEMVYRLRKDIPSKEFFPVSEKALCRMMKKITIEGLYDSLKQEQYEIDLDADIIDRARRSIERMLEVV